MGMAADETTRVDFNAPASLVERADTIAELRGISRTQLLTEALKSELNTVASDKVFRRRLVDAYYGGDIEFDTVESVLGTETAMRLKLLQESLDRTPPEPRLEESLPSDEEFYDGELSVWMPTEPETDG